MTHVVLSRAPSAFCSTLTAVSEYVREFYRAQVTSESSHINLMEREFVRKKKNICKCLSSWCIWDLVWIFRQYETGRRMRMFTSKASAKSHAPVPQLCNWLSRQLHWLPLWLHLVGKHQSTKDRIAFWMQHDVSNTQRWEHWGQDRTDTVTASRQSVSTQLCNQIAKFWVQ